MKKVENFHRTRKLLLCHLPNPVCPIAQHDDFSGAHHSSADGFLHLTDLPEEPGKRVVFSCAAGVRSARAIEFAQAFGQDVREHYKGGFKDWAMAGEEIA